MASREVNLRLDLTQKGLATAFRDYERIMLEHLWAVPDTIPASIVEATSRELTEEVDRKLPWLDTTRSPPDRRSKIINAANRFVNLGIWDYREVTGKGGYRKIYRAVMTEHELRKMIMDLVVEKLEG